MKFTEEHEWLKPEGDVVVVGITAHAAEALGEIVFVELPEADTEVAKDDEVVVIESVKAASDIYAPVSGEVVAVNDALDGEPELLNESPYESGWMIRIKASDLAELENLLSAEAYIASAQD